MAAVKIIAVAFQHVEHPTRGDLVALAGLLAILIAGQIVWWEVFGFPKPPLFANYDVDESVHTAVAAQAGEG